MEQNIQEQTAGPDSYLVRRGLGAAGKGHCLVVLARGSRDGSQEPDFTALNERMGSCAAPVVACYVLDKSIGHYGTVDQLAPAGAMAEFVAHVQAEHWEEARRIFAPLAEEIEHGRAELHVFNSAHEWEKALKQLEKLFESLCIFQPDA